MFDRRYFSGNTRRTKKRISDGSRQTGRIKMYSGQAFVGNRTANTAALSLGVIQSQWRVHRMRWRPGRMRAVARQVAADMPSSDGQVRREGTTSRWVSACAGSSVFVVHGVHSVAPYPCFCHRRIHYVSVRSTVLQQPCAQRTHWPRFTRTPPQNPLVYTITLISRV